MEFPEDPFILLSFVNTKLRDDYPDLDEFCASEGVDRSALEARLKSAGFEYMPQINQFR
ncbi:MAG: DUF4250 domain-containing protein [Muribaculaceae bacterium]|nr:DUF4250 domain-containing protein [Muribaculaceae bacterium]MDE6135705.1 DUF4250 domain-containing protein [Muribaculaceae bacterium]